MCFHAFSLFGCCLEQDVFIILAFTCTVVHKFLTLLEAHTLFTVVVAACWLSIPLNVPHVHLCMWYL